MSYCVDEITFELGAYLFETGMLGCEEWVVWMRECGDEVGELAILGEESLEAVG